MIVIGTGVSLHSAKSKVSRQSTDTTTLTTSDGMPERSTMVIGLPFPGMRKSWARISASSSPATKHESVASIVLQSKDASFDSLIGGDAVRPVEAPHCHIEAPHEIRHAIRSRRIDGAEFVQSGFAKRGLLSRKHRFAKYFALLGIALRPYHYLY